LTNKHQKITDEMCELLPWYVNGTLDESELDGMDRHLESCETCANEIPILRALQESVQRESVSVLAPKPDAEQFLANVDRRNKWPQRRKLVWFAGALTASVALLVAGLSWMQLDESTTTPVFYETVMSEGGAASYDYVLLVSFDPTAELTARNDALQALAPVSTAGPDSIGQYRVVVRLPARSMDELDDFVQSIEADSIISNAVVVAVELPVEAR